MGEIVRPLEAVRKRCLYCSNYQPKEIRLCPVTNFELYPFRFGRNPDKKTKLTLKIIRIKCIECSCYVLKEVRNCFKTDCPLYPFRMGKNPNKKRGYSKKGISCLKTPSDELKTEQTD